MFEICKCDISAIISSAGFRHVTHPVAVEINRGKRNTLVLTRHNLHSRVTNRPNLGALSASPRLIYRIYIFYMHIYIFLCTM